MENASKALIMAAGVLIGVIILSMAVYLFSVLGGYASKTQNRIDENKLSQFNDRFLKYADLTNLTIRDLITVKNYALENNKENGKYDASLATFRAGDNNDYVDVYFSESKATVHEQSKLILGKSDEDLLKYETNRANEAMANGEERYNYNRLTCKVEVNTTTGRVNKIYFYATN